MSTLLPKNEDDISTRSSLELLYHISRELSSALDLRTVLERILSLSMENVGAINGSIIVLDDHCAPVDSAIITGETVHNHTTERLKETLERGLSGWVVNHRQVGVVADTSRDSRWMARQYIDDGKQLPKSAVSVPLLTREKLVGVLTLVHPRTGFFTPDHVALVQAIADQAGIAALNAILYAQSQRNAQVMTSLAKSASGISASLNLEDVLTGILDQSERTIRAQVVMLELVNPQSGKLELTAVKEHLLDAIITPPRIIELGISDWVVKHDEGLNIHDVSQDIRYNAQTDNYHEIDANATLCAPIHYRGQVIGVLEAINPIEGEFTQDSLLILSGIADLAGTAIRHAQLFEQLQAAHQSYQELFEDSIDPILITNWDGEILEANRKAVVCSDYSKNDLRSMKIHQIHRINMDATGEDFAQLHSGETISYESSLCTSSGHEVPIQVYAHEIQLDETSRLQWTLRDITEQKKLDTLRNDLTSMIYHDLRSPLANIISSLDLLDTMLPSEDPALKSLLDISMRSTVRIQRMTETLLELSMMEAGQPLGKQKITSVLVLVYEAVEAVEALVHNKSQFVNYKLPDRLPNVSVDQEMIRRVIINLLENASKYSPQGSHIEIGARQEGDRILVWVKDNGPGIPASEQERIFDKFTRLKTDSAPKGLGLGLAYSRLALQAHSGKIWVESEIGAGSNFIFSLPVAPP